VSSIKACDQEISEMLGEREPRVDPAKKPLPSQIKRRTKRKHQRTGDFRFDVRTEAYKQFGVDVTRIPGLEGMALVLYSEVGNDMSRWRVAGQWTYLYRAIDSAGNTIDFLLSPKRDVIAAKGFLQHCVVASGPGPPASDQREWPSGVPFCYRAIEMLRRTRFEVPVSTGTRFVKKRILASQWFRIRRWRTEHDCRIRGHEHHPQRSNPLGS
jgi:hypothetical protein